MDIKDRIAKLLALSESPNTHEAKAAMLKAKELMAEYKVSAAAAWEKPNAEVIRYKSDIVCTRRHEAWKVDLAATIARNYCCRSYITRQKGGQKAYITFAGYWEDIHICLMVLRYALECIHGWTATIRHLCQELYNADDMRAILDSYARGFIRGTSTAYEQQMDKHREWSLVLRVPSEAEAIYASLKRYAFCGKSATIPNLYNQGFRDGMKFNPSEGISCNQTPEAAGI